MKSAFHHHRPSHLLCLLCIAFTAIVPLCSAANQETRFSFSSWQAIPHGQARFFRTSPALPTPDGQYAHGIELQLEPEWHSYWHNPGDSGAAPEILGIKGQQESQLTIAYPTPTRINVGPLTTYGYSGRVVYFFEMTSAFERLRADLLICKEECIPGSIAWQLNSAEQDQASEDDEFASFINKQTARLPTKTNLTGQYYPSMKGSRWQFKLPENQTLIDIFWYPEQVDNLHKPNILALNEGHYEFHRSDTFAQSDQPKALLVVENSGVTSSRVIRFNPQAPALLPFVLMAIVGGLILNLMPCVFPIVSLKAFTVASSAGKALTTVRRDQLFYCLGVITCFISLAFLISAIRASGQMIGWGFQLQNPWLVGALCLLFIILALSFFDVWNIQRIPGLSILSEKGAGSGPIPSFITGLLAVIVASPCTAPFMGAAIGFALSQSSMIIFAVFFGLGLGMSLPFLLLAIFPSFSRLLPSPGNWMIVFKKIMGIFLLLTALWLAWLGWQLVRVDPKDDQAEWLTLEVRQWQELQQAPHARFVNFTADWCVSCKVNERVVFADVEVKDFFDQQQITLYKVDWTHRENEIGTKLAEFGRAGVPLYLYFAEGSDTPTVLPELLTPNLLMTRIKAINKQ